MLIIVTPLKDFFSPNLHFNKHKILALYLKDIYAITWAEKTVTVFDFFNFCMINTVACSLGNLPSLSPTNILSHQQIYFLTLSLTLSQVSINCLSIRQKVNCHWFALNCWILSEKLQFLYQHGFGRVWWWVSLPIFYKNNFVFYCLNHFASSNL